MTRALVLNAGASWAAYQVGALGWVVRERVPSFDLVAGTGIGAMNAAFVGCGELDALEAFWRRLRAWRLVRPTLRRPWLGPMDGAPQRRAIAAHVAEDKLAARGTTLLVSTLDLQAGEQRVLEYPGSDVPLVDGLMAAVATPGLVAPVVHGGRRLAEGTLVESFLLRTVLAREPDEVVAIAPALPHEAPRRRYATWRAVSERALAVNLDHDVTSALAHTRTAERVTAARTHVRDALLALTDDEAVRERIAAIYGEPRAPVLHAVTPSGELGYPLWSFPRARMRAAAAMGRADAEAAFA
jgi:predicted acylesterase/phospholipase RssA